MEFSVSATFNAKAQDIYNAWLSSEGHTAMTGGEASCGAQEGEEFSAWDGYIWGKNLALRPNKRILQSWRTSEFSDDEEDSELEVILEETNGQTKVTLNHKNLPAHGEQYIKGWDKHYFIPMKEYFG